MKIAKLRKKEIKAFSIIVSEIIKKIPYYSSEAKKSEIKKFSPSQLRLKMADKNNILLTAEDGKSIIGFCTGYFDAGTFWVDWLGVKNGYRHHGVAHKFSTFLLKILKAHQVHKVWFDTRTNNKESIDFITKLGFRKVATLHKHWYKQDFNLWYKFIRK